MLSPVLSSHLNMLRWTAALMVVVSHIRPLLFVEYSDAENKNLFIKLFYFLTGFGHEAVMVFFVISGLLVGGISARKFQEGSFTGRSYAVHRFARIYLVFIPALAAGYLLDWIGIAYLDASGVYSNTMQYRFTGNAEERLSPLIAAGNLLMLQEILVSPLGSNNPLWSLAYEWWYYLLFFFGLQLLGSRGCWRRALLYGSLLIGTLSLLPWQILLWFAIWLAGTAVVLSSRLSWRLPSAGAYLVFIIALVWSRLDNIWTEDYTTGGNFIRDCIVAGACFMLFMSLNRDGAAPPLRSRIHVVLAEFSYSTYLVHVPFLLFVVALLYTAFGIPLVQQPSPSGLVYFACILLLVYFYSYCFYLMTERHTDTFRRYLSRRFDAGRKVRLPEAA